MSSKSDHELLAEIREGRRIALGELFDRYSPALYEFIYRIIGDRDQTARLLEEVFARVTGAASTLDDHVPVRGWLYGLAREMSLGFLRQKGWLDALPPSSEPTASGLAGDVWSAARGIPAFHRAVLIVEELHGLSPTEKAHALGIARTDFTRLLDEARRLFNAQFDTQAQQQNRPLSNQIDPERIWGMRRRLGSSGSLFGYLPVFVLPESLAAAIRSRVLASSRMTVGGPPPPPPATIPPQNAAVSESSVSAAGSGSLFEGCAWQWIGAAMLVAIVIILFALGIGYLLTRDSTAPTITLVDPPQDATLPYNPTPGGTLTRVTIKANYRDDRTVDVGTVKLVVDGRDVTQLSVVGDSLTSFTADLESGKHVVLIDIRDTSGNRVSRAWQFTIGNAPEPTATPTLIPTIVPTPLPTRVIGPTGTATVFPPPAIVLFTASPTVITRGAPSLIQWNVNNADQVFLNQEKVDPVSSRLVSPNNTTTYYLIANNSGGTTTASLTITVQDLADLTVTDVTLTASNQVEFVIRNIGGGDVSRPFLIQVTANGVVVESDRPISSLPSQQEAHLIVPNYLPAGTVSISVNVNLLQEVQESNYNNNVLVRTLVGPTPTLTVTPTPSITPTASPAPGTVTGVNANINTPTYTGPCPGSFSFVGTITMSGPGTITYRWEHSDGGASAYQSLYFSAAGTQTVYDTWSSVGFSITSGFNTLHVTSPNNLYSNQATFTNSCTITPSPTPVTPSPTPITPTPTITPVPGTVTSVVVSASPLTYTGQCPANIFFSGTIVMSGPGTVTYRWERSDGSSTATKTLNFSGAGPQNVTDQWNPVPPSQINGYEVIHVISPNDIISVPAATFTNNCIGIVTAATIDSVTPTSFTGTCGTPTPVTLNFSGALTTNGPVTVNYRWERSDSTTNAATISFSSAGTQSVTDSWVFTGTITTTASNILHVTSPNNLSSTPKTFTYNCH